MDSIANIDVSEIEVTPDMIEAGLLELYAYSPDRSELTAEETVEEIYRLMERVRLRNLSAAAKAGNGGETLRVSARITSSNHKTRVTPR